jgi:hypothetical protein
MLPGLRSCLCLWINYFPSRNCPFPQSLCQSSELLVRRTTCTPPRNSLISLTLRKIANFCIGNLICAHYRFIDGHYIAFSVTVRMSALFMDNPPDFLNKFPPKTVKPETATLAQKWQIHCRILSQYSGSCDLLI